ncbi:MAG: hypothetical protein FWB71_07325 [Defluviitaleaceae bacterium]|nr:hypothetical protein [Defluviitaleaceae bacterium]
MEIEAIKSTDCKKTQALQKLLADLDKGRKSGEMDGWIPADDIWTKLEEKYND